MDEHFTVLGLKRGSSEGDMKKAYHKRALEYHPDRNPSGAEMFKRVNVAYEALQKHFKTHGGLDFVSSTTSASSSYFASGTDDPFAATMPAASFRRYPFRPFRQSSSGASAPPMFNEDAAAAAERVAKAHGGRTPVSGYDPFHGESDEMNAFMSQAKHFADMERRKANLQQSSSSATAADSAKNPAPTSSRPSPPADHHPEHTSSSKSASTRPAHKPCHQQLSDEWHEVRRQAEEEARSQQMIHEAERRSRKEQIDKETREEWERMCAEMERKTSTERATESESQAMERLRQQRATNEQLKALQKERRELKKQLFSGRMPSSGEVSRMSEMELFVMQDVLQTALDNVSRAFRERMRDSAPCCMCSVNSKDTTAFRFECRHRATCTSCGRAAFSCPVCGAENLDLMKTDEE